MTPYYDEAGITIYHADCRDVLPTLDPVEALITDPPYGVGMDDFADDFDAAVAGLTLARAGVAAVFTSPPVPISSGR